jgi:hypothetical protein
MLAFAIATTLRRLEQPETSRRRAPTAATAASGRRHLAAESGLVYPAEPTFASVSRLVPLP